MVNSSLRLISIDGQSLENRPGTTCSPAPDEPGLDHFQRLGLTIARVAEARTQLTGSFSHRLDLRVACRPHETEDHATPIVWNVLGHWRRPRRLYLVNSEIDEWLGLPCLDAFALLRGMRNDAQAENSGPAAVSDCFEHGGRRVINPFRDRYGNDTSPLSEYGNGYRLWRARWTDVAQNG